MHRVHILDQSYRQILSDFYSQHRVGKNYVRLTLKNPRHRLRLLKFFGALKGSKLALDYDVYEGVSHAPMVSLD